MRSLFAILLFFLVFSSGVIAQADSLRISDSTELAKEQRKKIYSTPRKASIMSAVLPGLGQVYNGKYWKVPVIYAAAGGLSYFFYVNNSEYNDYRRALKESLTNGGSATVAGNTYLTEDLQSQKLYYRKFRDMAAIGIGIVYLFNIIDANVDAHLRTFDVSDDLSFMLSPSGSIFYSGNGARTAAGLSLKLNFK